jgi:hypothetical protein
VSSSPTPPSTPMAPISHVLCVYRSSLTLLINTTCSSLAASTHRHSHICLLSLSLPLLHPNQKLRVSMSSCAPRNSCKHTLVPHHGQRIMSPTHAPSLAMAPTCCVCLGVFGTSLTPPTARGDGPRSSSRLTYAYGIVLTRIHRPHTLTRSTVHPVLL